MRPVYQGDQFTSETSLPGRPVYQGDQFTCSSTQKLTLRLTPVAPTSLQESIVLLWKASRYRTLGKVAEKLHFVFLLVLVRDNLTFSSSDNSLPTLFLVDIIDISGCSRTGRLFFVAPRELQTVLARYPAHVTCGVSHHCGILSCSEIINE